MRDHSCKDFICTDEGLHSPNQFGGSHDARVDTRWGLAFKLPWDHTQPNTVVDRGLITVLEAERCRPDLWRAYSTRDQFSSSSSGVFPPQYRSSAILATTPAVRRSPNTLHISSSSAVSEPGMPMAVLV